MCARFDRERALGPASVYSCAAKCLSRWFAWGCLHVIDHAQDSGAVRTKDAVNDDAFATGQIRVIGCSDHYRIRDAIDSFESEGEDEEGNCDECCATHDRRGAVRRQSEDHRRCDYAIMHSNCMSNCSIIDCFACNVCVGAWVGG